MDDLLKLIEKLRERIDSHQAELRKNEALTRSVLIDPLLRALGWDTEDPSQVIPEWPIRSEPAKHADYALFIGREDPVIIVEAKKLGVSLSDAAEQALHYCNRDGYRYFAVTDGRLWTVYLTHKPVPLDRKKIVRFDLLEDSPIQAYRAVRGLWRQIFVSGASVSGDVAQVPKAATSLHDPPPPTVVASQRDHTVRHHTGDWIPLSILNPQSGSGPQEMRLPSGDIRGVTHWSQLVLMVTKWLMEEGHLVEKSMPIRSTDNRYVVAAQPKHNNCQRKVEMSPFPQSRDVPFGRPRVPSFRRLG